MNACTYVTEYGIFYGSIPYFMATNQLLPRVDSFITSHSRQTWSPPQSEWAKIRTYVAINFPYLARELTA